ncbi:muscle M-line assembly protein unc-89-like isoform X1 [Zingiber officinale]|uniref:Uncharacterized protein n=1 Tax=Zingiber officinale TaxID=94328 RepID=A0A8J5L9C9_ZINOF|nr:muscle M-line assembly protein unc-89-like isoform X1 [Zingiber officinale]KAG6509681.1 hypothetical protein ZIOFF_027681 [Zingiber officinale]
MEPTVIDWKRVDSRYVRDEAYENINAPMWLDLAAANGDVQVDDTAWFCRPDCNHPKTAEDFKLSATPSPKAKLMRSSSERLPFGERNSNRRDENNLKKRVGVVAAPLLSASPVKPKTTASKVSKVDLENQDPNQSTPARPTRPPKTRNPVKEIIKSSTKEEVEDKREGPKQKKVQPRLKSTMSARNLFSGKDILSQISEFYRELKKMAVGSRTPPVREEARKEVKEAAENLHKPEPADDTKLLTPNKNDKSPQKRGKLKIEIKKSIPLKEVRANPPTPQRFPSPRGARNPKATPNGRSPLHNKPPKSTTLGRAILQDREEKKALLALKDDEQGCSSAAVAGNSEAASADLFWFLKPCSHAE